MTSSAHSPVRLPLRAATFLLILVLSACAGLGAKKHYNAGQKAEQQGDLTTAMREYEAASLAQPANSEFKDALERSKKEAAAGHGKAAREAEARQDWPAAVEHWRSALRLFPGNGELEARLALAELRTRRSDPTEFHEAASKLAASLPNDPDVAKLVADASADAFRYAIKLGETFFEGGSFTAAFEAFERARKVEPDHATFKGPKYRIARGRHFEAIGDGKLKAGDALAAFSAYQEATAAADLPGLRNKLERARRGAGPMIEQLDQARAFERLQKWEDAAELFTLIRERADAPPDVAEAAVRARKMSAKIRADRAATFADQGATEKATAALALALEHTDGAKPLIDQLQAGMDELDSGKVSEAKARFDESKRAAPDLPVVDAALKVTTSRAKQEFEAAKAEANRDPAAAMLRVTRLSAFKAELPTYDQVRTQLVKKAFAVLLERASSKAKEGRPKEAAELFAIALEIAAAPAALKEPLDRGSKALGGGDFRTAEDSFRGAQKTDPRSRLATAGLEIAAALRLSELRRTAREALKSGDSPKAAAAFREILDVQPDDTEATSGLDALKPALLGASLSSADAHRAAKRPGSAYIYYRRVLELDPKHPSAGEAITELTAAFDMRKDPLAWVAPVRRSDKLGDACKGAEGDLRERLVLYLTRTKNLGTDFLQRDGTLEIDGGKRPAPSVELVSALEHCAINEAGGNVAVTYQVRIAGEPAIQDRVATAFDPKTLPKDEAGEGGFDAKGVLDTLLKESAKLIALGLQKESSKLADWRAFEARARLKAGEPEGVAYAYARLMLDQERLSPAEREVLRELERFVIQKLK